MVLNKMKKIIAKKGKSIKKETVSKKAPAKVAKKAIKIAKAYTKTEIVTHIAESNDLPKTQAVKVLESFTNLIENHLQKNGPGEFVLPGIAKFRIVRKEAKKARQGINPFTGESMKYAAKPAHNVVKIRPLKKLKDIIV